MKIIFLYFLFFLYKILFYFFTQLTEKIEQNRINSVGYYLFFVKLSQKVEKHWIKSIEYYSFQSYEKFLKYFIPNNVTLYDAKIYDIQDMNMTEKKLNILICVENCNYHTHYNHYNKYGNYGDDKIQIYFYNHIDKIKVTDNYISIPVIYTQINYFTTFYSEIKPSIQIPFNKKKFCLFAYNKNFINELKNDVIKTLRNIGTCDDLQMYKSLLKNKSCYHSIELLNILQEYKFIFVCENSTGDGYITEKIFNCFFSRCIPIYIGCKNIEYYFNNNCFINANDDNLNKVVEILHNEELFYKIIHTHKIASCYNDEDYKFKLKTFIDTY
jgi:hypothetical protein